MKTYYFIQLLLCLSFPVLSQTVYVQASPGSFNDLAFQKLNKRPHQLQLQASFSGSLLNTFKMGNQQNGLVFTAVSNSLIKHHLVPQAVSAVQQYRINTIFQSVSLDIQFCAYVRNSIMKPVNIDIVVSHPAALQQISHWLSKHKYQARNELGGTAKAVKDLSEGKYKANTIAVGACDLEQRFKNISVYANGIGDSKSSKTHFLLMNVKKRKSALSYQQAFLILENKYKEFLSETKSVWL